jgi:hypothetical protein
MALTPQGTTDRSADSNRSASVNESLARIERLIQLHGDRPADEEFHEKLSDELHTLHALMRAYHPAGARPQVNEEDCTPECVSDLDRLCEEHGAFLGMLDRLLRAVESMAGRPMEDQTVFILKVQELAAMIRRHEAEERRLIYLSMWRDTGGES